MESQKRQATNRNKEVMEAFKALDDKVTKLLNILIGNAEEDKPGLMERVRKLEEWVASEKRLIYLIVGIIITDIVTRVFSLIVK